MPDLERKIIIDTSDVELAKKQAKELLNQLEDGEQKQSRAQKRGLAKRVQNLRNALSEQIRNIRAANRFRQQELQKSLRKGLISEKKFQKERVRLQKDADQEIADSQRKARGAAPDAAGLGAGGVGAVAGIVAGAGITRIAGEAVEAAKELELAQKGLISTSKAFGQSQEEALAAVEELTQDGLLTFEQAAQGLKSLLGTGFSVSEALELSKGLKDVGSFNNIVGDLGQAFVDSTKGIKTNSIELIENIGLTTRLGAALQKQGFNTDDLSSKTKGLAAREALRNIILQDTSKFSGDAAKFTETFAGAQARLNTATTQLAASLGGAIQQVFAPFVSFLADGLEKAKEFFDGLGNGTKIIATLSAVVAGLAVPISAAVTAFGGFAAITTLINPVALAVAGIAAAIGALAIAFDKLAPSADSFIKQLREEEKVGRKTIETVKELSKRKRLSIQDEIKLAQAKQQLNEDAKALNVSLRDENGILKTQAQLIRDVNAARSEGAIAKLVEERQDLLLTQGRLNRLLIEGGTSLAVFGEASVRSRLDSVNKEILAINTEISVRNKAGEVAVKSERKKTAAVKKGTEDRRQEREQTTLEQLRAQEFFLQQSAALTENAENEAAANAAIEDIQAQQRDILRLENFQRVEEEKLALEARIRERRKSDDQKELRRQLKLKTIEFKAEQNKLRAIQKADAESKRFRAALADRLFDATEALLSKEEGAFKRFLAGQIRSFTRFIAKKLFLEGTAKLANPLTAGIGFAQIAAAGAVTVGGITLAQALESEADETGDQNFDAGDFRRELENGDIVESGVTDGILGGGTAGGTTIINNFNNQQEVNAEFTGTFLDTAEAVRERLQPSLEQLRIERGEIVFS